MLKKLLDILASYRTMALLAAIYVVAIAVATFVESFADTTSARVLIYNAWWFIALQIIMSINFILIAYRRSLFAQRKWGALILHYGMVVILAGALTTHLFSREGMMMVREGDSSVQMLSSETYITATLVEGTKRETKKKQVNFGKYAQTPFTISFEGKHPAEIKFVSHTKIDMGERIEVEVNGKLVSITGGRYSYMAPSIVAIDNSAYLELSYGGEVENLPFTLHLNDFELVRYPGSSSPSSFSSDVDILYKGKKRNYNIYMNNIAYVGSYRLYQTSYDKDEKGTILTVNHDLWGTIITYLGYVMLALGLVLSLLHKGSRFAMLGRRLREISSAAILLIILMPATASAANSMNELPEPLRVSVMNKQLARDFSHLLVQSSDGRVEPLNTYALKVVRKLTHSSSYMGLTAEQLLMAIVADPPRWSNVPLMEVGDETLIERLGGVVYDGYVSYAGLFDENGVYKLQSEMERVYAKSAQTRSHYEKEILKLDEKANILNALFNGVMLPMFPIQGDPDGRWISMGDDVTQLADSRDSLFVSSVMPWFIAEALLGTEETSREVIEMMKVYQRAKADADHLVSESKIKWEIFYNRSNIFKRVGLSYLIFGALLLSLLLVQLLKGGSSKRMKRLIGVLGVVLIAAFLAHTFGIGLRWYISGRAPWTSSYESMVYVSWSAVLLGLLFVRRSWVTLAISALMGGAVVMISQLSLMDPEITTLVPVLKSYWLMFHVATITASYGFFGVAALLGLSVMIIYACGGGERLKSRIEELTIINEMAITLGLVLLTIGIFLGAVWANESWGRYWGWDPKESWALITMVVYAIVLHVRFMPRLRGSFLFSAMSIFAFYTVLMTFFGVNYYLVGMHSYGQVDGIAPLAVVVPTTIVLLITIVAYLRRKH